MVDMDMGRRLTARPTGRPEYRFYTALLFPFSLLAVLAGRLSGRRSRFAGPRTSILGETCELSRNVIPWVFMGR